MRNEHNSAEITRYAAECRRLAAMSQRAKVASAAMRKPQEARGEWQEQLLSVLRPGATAAAR